MINLTQFWSRSALSIGRLQSSNHRLQPVPFPSSGPLRATLLQATLLVMADPTTVVKPDPEAMDGGASPMSVVDDPFEDHDLEFYNPVDVNGIPTPQEHLLMARVPTYVWAAWDKIDDDTPIEIGRLRMWSEPDKKFPHAKKEKTRLLLKSNVGAHEGLPREYDLVNTQHDVKNTFIFTETDLDAFKKKNKIRRDAANQNIPSYLLRKKVDPATAPPREPRGSRRNRKDTFRQVIPKKTAVYGRVRQEANMNPIDNPETAYLMAVRAQDQIKPKHTTQIIDRITVTNGAMLAGSQQANEAFQSFIVSYPLSTRTARPHLLISGYRKVPRPPKTRSRPGPKPRLLACPRTSYWTGFSVLSASTITGASRRSKPRFPSPRCTCAQRWTRWPP